MTHQPKTTDPAIATGDRRDELHYEADPDQLVKMRATAKPRGPLPPQQQSEAAETGADSSAPPIEDVAIVASGPSVWDARPTDDET